jgi:hypothetical protein
LIGLALELPQLRLGFAEQPDKRLKTSRRMNKSDLSSEQ